jgi:hypothetical protein
MVARDSNSRDDSRIECPLKSSWGEEATALEDASREEEQIGEEQDDLVGEGVEVDNLSVVGSYIDTSNIKSRRRRLCLGSLCCIVILGAILAPSISIPKKNDKAIASASNGPQTQDEFEQLWATGCYQPTSCTDEVLDRVADGYTCRARMQWLMDVLGYSRWEACLELSAVEFPTICGPCDPAGEIEVEFEYLAELYCYQPSRCTDEVLSTMAGQYPCGERIQWLMNVVGESLGDACFQIAITEFPVQCGGCDPTGGTSVYVPGVPPVEGTGQTGDDNSEPASSVGGQPANDTGETPTGPPPAGQPPTGQPPTGQPPTGQPPTGQPPTGQPPTGQPPTGQPPNNGGGDIGIGGGNSEGQTFLGTPFSTLHPVNDLNMFGSDRPAGSSPSGRLQTTESTYPTNAWYQNMLHLRENEAPTNDHRAYPIPYVVDVNGRIPGLRVHTFRNIATSTAVTLTVDEPYALTLGATEDFSGRSIAMGDAKGYTVRKANDLGFTLEWVRTYMLKHATKMGFTATDIRPLLIAGLYGNEILNCKRNALCNNDLS